MLLPLITILLIACLIFLTIMVFYKNRVLFVNSWQKMATFEKYSLKIGLGLFFVVPLLKQHPSKDSYITMVLTDLCSALASALFILGMLVFLKYAHELQNPDCNKTANK